LPHSNQNVEPIEEALAFISAFSKQSGIDFKDYRLDLACDEEKNNFHTPHKGGKGKISLKKFSQSHNKSSSWTSTKAKKKSLDFQM
jgi:hypothetical protein